MKANMEIAISLSTIVPEVLQKDNYERWSILMQHYLVAQDLWDVVQSSKMPRGGNKREWIRKNALALHAIGISCGTEAFDQIKKIRSAKGAWDALAVMLKPTVVEVVTHDMFEHHQGRQTEEQETLQKFICNGPISSVKRFLRDHPDARSPQMLHFALHVAITYGRKNMARYFYREIPLEFLREEGHGFFLLEECITKKTFDIALDLLHHFPELAFKCPSGSIPIILTLAQTPPPFLTLNELGFWGQWIYESTRVKVFSIKPRSDSTGDVGGIVLDQLGKWTLALYKFHLVGVMMIGLLCWLPATFEMYGINLLIGAFLLAVIFRKRDLVQVPIGMPLFIIGAPIWLTFGESGPLEVILFPLLLLFSMPLLIFVIQIYKQKLMDEYALEVIRFICGSLSNLDENQFVQSGAVEATFQAIKNGIPEIVIELITKANNANILWSSTGLLEDSRNMFTCAVAHRQEKVAHFLHKFGLSKEINMVTTIDEDGNNTIHLAAKLAPHSQLDHISGAALRLQSELRWFKSVEGIAPEFYNKQKNKGDETPTQLFVREHGCLLKEAEGWMKEVAKSSTVVGALVVTIMFAAAFTVPGGNNEETGFPIFLNKTSSNTTSSNTTPFSTVVPFVVFTVSDAISLFAASSSVLMFMGILTSRYAFQDFHRSLPYKLIIGLSSLFVSIAAMMIAFCATLFMMLHDRLRMVITIIFLAGIPVILFVSLQSPLLVEIYTSTLRPDIFCRRIYSKSRMRVCLSLNRRWWFRTTKGRMVIMLCALFLLYGVTLYIL